MSEQLAPITFELLRSRGFRLCIPYGNYEPHMRIEISRDVSTWLEIGKCGSADKVEWTCWIVGEASHRYANMCFLRDVWTMGQVCELYQGLTGNELPREEYDAKQFEEGMTYTRESCRRGWAHYTSDDLRRHILIR